MFAGQQAYQTWPQPLPPPDDPGPDAAGTESVVAPGTRRSLALPIVLGVLGLAALGLIGLLGTLLLRPTAAPKTASTLPAPASTLPSLVEATSNLPSQAVEPERALSPEPPPIQFGASQQASLEAISPSESTTVLAPSTVPAPPARDSGAADVLMPLPPPRPPGFTLGPTVVPASGYDKWTAVYDISAHTVYLPDGTRLEAHSGLGGDRDDPRFVDERDRGATPPHLYELTLRESLFHGVQALRLTPIGEGFSFDRTGLLAHPYMLGPAGDSNGCVSFKNYDAFLRAFQSGVVRHLAVVARWTEDPRQVGRFASLRQGVDR
jgi:hypothetical protein